MKKNQYSYTDLERMFYNSIRQVKQLQSIPNDLFNLKPSPKAWSADEICRHLIKFNTIYLDTIGPIQESKPTVEDHKSFFKPRTLIGWMIRFLEPPYRVKIKTMEPMYPGHVDDKPPSKITNELEQTLERASVFIKMASEHQLDIDEIKIKHPLFKFRMTITEYLLMFDTHHRRHMWQLQQTLIRMSGDDPFSS